MPLLRDCFDLPFAISSLLMVYNKTSAVKDVCSFNNANKTEEENTGKNYFLT